VATRKQIREIANRAETWRSIAWSPDGKLIAAGGNADVLLWDGETGDPGGRLAGHTSQIRGLSFSGDSQTLATSSVDHQVKLWNVADRSLLKTLSGHKHYASAVALSRSGKWVASGGWDNTVKLWDAATGDVKFDIPAQPGVAQGMAFSPDERFFASASSGGHVRVWNARNGKLSVELKFPRPASRVWAVAYNADGSLLAVGADRILGLWNPTTGSMVKELSPMHRSGILSLAWSRDGRRLATGSGDVDGLHGGPIDLWSLPPTAALVGGPSK
jgi:WD40 repeat protein